MMRTAVTVIATMLLGFVIHGVLLKTDYAALPNIMRSEAESMNYFHWMIVAHVLMGFALTWIYRHGDVRARHDDGEVARLTVALDAASTAQLERRLGR